MTSDGQALLRSVLTFPEEDTPRLVLADYLDEQGEHDRAAFIRVQVELARSCRCVDDWRAEIDWSVFKPRCGRTDGRLCPDLIPLRARERELLNDPHPAGNYRIYSNKLGWAEDIRQWAKYTYTRGFVSRIELPVAAFLEHAAAIFAAQPVVSVCLSDARPSEDSAVGSTRCGWSIADGNPPDGTDPGMGYLPLALLRGLSRMTTSPVDAWNLGLAVYANAADANADLCESAVAFGRKLAGLPTG